jgi:hypothetical protein
MCLQFPSLFTLSSVAKGFTQIRLTIQVKLNKTNGDGA